MQGERGSAVVRAPFEKREGLDPPYTRLNVCLVRLESRGGRPHIWFAYLRVIGTRFWMAY